MSYPKISYSGLERWERCNYQWKLNREKKRKSIDPEYVVDGNAMHAGLEALISGVPADATSLALRFWTMRVKEEAIRWTEEEKRQHFNRVQEGMRRLADVVGEWSEGRLLSEVKMIHVGQGWAMEGIFDIWYQPLQSEGFEIWDLKTGQWHKDQLIFYDLLCEMGTGRRPEKLGIIEPFGQGLIEVPVDEDSRADMRKRIQSMASAIAFDDYEFNGYSGACGWCRSKPWCPQWENAREGRLELGA